MNQKSWESLTETTSKGKTMMWNISVTETNEGSVIKTEFGYVDGKKQIQEKLITEGKNLGKKNETTPFDQACKEAESLWKKKKDKQSVILPMLAQDYTKHKNKIVYPCIVQPKLDGIRMIAVMKDNSVSFYSRMGKELQGLDHIKQEIESKEIMENGDIWDGELYTEDMTFDELSGYSRNQKTRNNTKYPKFWVFDSCNTRLDFPDRRPMFEAFHYPKYLREVTYEVVQTEEEAERLLNEYINQGYEGIMLRNKVGTYKFNYRSYDLQKWKRFEDHEFIITDVVEGKGLDKNTGIFVCKADNGNLFQVKPEGTKEIRTEYFTNKSKYIGKFLTVKYQELTKTGVPRFPVGLRIRTEI